MTLETGVDGGAVRGALVRQWRAIALEAPARDLDADSRVAGWRNREVLAHLTMQPALLARFLRTAGDEAPQLDAAQNLAGTRNLAELVDAATREAAAAGRIDFAAAADEAIAALEAADLTATVTTLQGPILLVDYLVTRCVEAVVHGGDLVPPVAPDGDAQRIVADALLRLLETRDAALVAEAQSMPPDEWIVIATGRESAPTRFQRVVPLMA
jgi:Mycothiol maleylpyruvate isomerase N-terminal domain